MVAAAMEVEAAAAVTVAAAEADSEAAAQASDPVTLPPLSSLPDTRHPPLDTEEAAVLVAALEAAAAGVAPDTASRPPLDTAKSAADTKRTTFLT